MAEAQNQLQKLTECCICLKTFTDPRMLPCIHTFCLKCLEKTREATREEPGESMPCPLCRKVLIIPEEGMNGLQKNFFMRHLMDVMELQVQDTIDCDICTALHEGDEEKIKEATMRCLECRDNFCDVCSKTHKLHHKSSKTHNIVKIGSETEEDIRNMNPTRNCSVHNQQPLNFYCADCKKIICVSCFVENHATHTCKDVTTVDKEFRKIIELNAIKISKCIAEMSYKGREAEHRTTRVLRKFSEMEDVIRKRNLELKEMVDSHTDSLLDELSLMKQKQIKDIALDKEEIERSHAILSSFEAYCTALRSKGSPYDICGCVDELLDRASELEKDHEAFVYRPKQHTKVSFKSTEFTEILNTQSFNIVGQIQEVLSHQGLDNFGSALAQCLCRTYPLLEELCSSNKLQQPLTAAFVEFWKHKDTPEQNGALTELIEQTYLYTSSPESSNTQQRESRDLFNRLLSGLKSEQIPDEVEWSPFSYHVTAVDKVFGGHVVTTYTCHNCCQPNRLCESILDISLPISVPHQQQPLEGEPGSAHQLYRKREISSRKFGRNKSRLGSSYSEHVIKSDRVHLETHNKDRIIIDGKDIGSSTKAVTLSDCLRFYTTTEHAPKSFVCCSCGGGKQVDSMYCEEAKIAIATTKSQIMRPDMTRTLIYNPPAVLVLHINRFEKTATGLTKRSDMVAYEELLDLGPYCSSDCLHVEPGDKNVWYSLYGVVLHNGPAEFGHFTAFV